MAERLPPQAQMLLTGASWGTSFLFIKLAVAHGLPPFALAAARAGIAGSAIAVWLTVRGKTQLPSARTALTLGLLNGLIPNALLAFALTRIDSAPAAILQASTPVFVVLATRIFLAEEILTRPQWVSVFLGLLGLAVLIGPSAIANGRATTLGSIAVLGASASYAGAALVIKRLRPPDPAATALGQQIAAAGMAVALAYCLESPVSWIQPRSVWLALFGLAVVSTALPVVLYFNLVGRIGAARSALVHYLIPVAAVFYGIALLGERLAIGSVVGGSIVLAAVWTANRPEPVRAVHERAHWTRPQP